MARHRVVTTLAGPGIAAAIGAALLLLLALEQLWEKAGPHSHTHKSLVHHIIKRSAAKQRGGMGDGFDMSLISFDDWLKNSSKLVGEWQEGPTHTPGNLIQYPKTCPAGCVASFKSRVEAAEALRCKKIAEEGLSNLIGAAQTLPLGHGRFTRLGNGLGEPRMEASMKYDLVYEYEGLPLMGDFKRSEQAGALAATLTALQRAWNVGGPGAAVAEIGVHHGAFFLSLAATARSSEPLLAVDLFEKLQELNVDQSGHGVLSIFLANVAAAGLLNPPAGSSSPGGVAAASELGITVWAGSSSKLPPSCLCNALAPGPGIRMLSIDGGHTRDIVINDLAFAECHLADGGIAILDDYSDPYWPGVHEGVVSYFAAHRSPLSTNASSLGKGSASASHLALPETRLAPFLIFANKLWVTTASHHARYLSAVTSMPFWRDACRTEVEYFNGRRICIQAPGVNGGNLARLNLAGIPLAVAEHRDFNTRQLRQLWYDSLMAC